ncbi:MAG: signal peptide peptidase SppA, partial [Desulfonatronovibrionaceae bacterium]
MEKKSRSSFSERHPLAFGFFLIFAAVVIFMMAMAVFNFLFLGENRGIGKKHNAGLVNVSGLITDSRDLVQWIETLRQSESIRGVLIRINSPGGVVAPSQEIYAAVERLAREKPVVVSMGAMAASGGYYVVSPAHKIFASPGSLTASIGVKVNLTNIQKLLEKIGIQDETVYSGKFKDAGNAARPLTDEEKKYFQSITDDLHDQFIRDVARGREMEPDQVRRLADGRAMTGRQALKAGLVDELGGMHKALEELKELAEISEVVELAEGPEEEVSLLQRIVGEFSLENHATG